MLPYTSLLASPQRRWPSPRSADSVPLYQACSSCQWPDASVKITIGVIAEQVAKSAWKRSDCWRELLPARRSSFWKMAQLGDGRQMGTLLMEVSLASRKLPDEFNCGLRHPLFTTGLMHRRVIVSV